MRKNITDFLDRKTVIAAFNKAAQSYDQAAVLQREIADRLLDRLELVQIQPEIILDIGARTGYTSHLLAERYTKAQVIAVDWAENLLRFKEQKSILKICAEPEKLPLPAECADLIVANLVWHWVDDKMRCLQEWRRLLKPGGLLLFTTLGPDTLHELRASFAEVDEHPHVHLFLDMHDIGDLLMAVKFAEPVMQAEHLFLTYSHLKDLFRDLRNTGVTNALRARRQSLYGKQRWQKMQDRYNNFSSIEYGFPATMEVIYGIGWVAAQASVNYQDENGNILIPISNLKKVA